MYGFLSWDWAGLVIALPIALIGVALLRARRSRTGGVRHTLAIVGWPLAVLGVLLSISSAIHGVMVLRARAMYPAPGEFVDVGGYRMHYLAEGQNRGNPTIVWIPGGHGPGYHFHNFHRIFRDKTRSIIFDRPGSGWSDRGPYPRTTRREIDEFHRMIEASGEAERFVLVGHSYGGFFAASYAMRYPDKVLGLVLLDSGTVENWENPEAAGYMQMSSRISFYDALFQTFGIPFSILNWTAGDQIKPILAHYERELGEAWDTSVAMGVMSMNAYGTSSIFNESADPEFFQHGRVIPGVLDGKPAIYITSLGDLDLDSDEALAKVQQITGLDEAGALGQLAGLKRNRALVTSLSDQMEVVSIPDGAGHNFPYERPDVVIEQVERLIARIRAARG